ncbi:MAG: hypothetical protein B6U94_04465 [Thermofilum sp. ex4484_79]|nr:MAG: hypothetical protein B6U94_04465 [Thermofilum sp. ex4484_79]
MKTRITTISIKSSTKRIIEKVKKNYEKSLNRKLSWDDFLLFLLSSEKRVERFKDISILELSEDEAELLRELLEKGRESWKKRALTQVS